MSARILVIEDHADSRALLAYLLTAFGHQPFTACDGLGGLALARQCQPQMVLCDIQLPDIDGFEIARRLRAEPEFADVPLIAVTASARSSDRQRVLDVGFHGYFSKPIDPETFVAQIEAFLPAHLRTNPGRTRADEC